MWKALGRAGGTAPRCRVQRLMAANGIQGAKRRGRPWRTTIPDPAGQRHPDLVERDFSAGRPNTLWVGDFTYGPAGRASCSSRSCWTSSAAWSFGWQFAAHMRTELVQDALEMAVGSRRPDRDALLIHHSDRGSQPPAPSPYATATMRLGTAGSAEQAAKGCCFALGASASWAEEQTTAADERRASVSCAAGARFGVEASASGVQSDALESGEIEWRPIAVCLGRGESPRSPASRSDGVKGTRG